MIRAPETSPCRRASIQNSGLDPRRVTAAERSRRGNRDPRPLGFSPKAASAPVRNRFGRRAAAVVASVTPHCHRGPARGPIQASGSGPLPQPGSSGSNPKVKPVRSRSPVSAPVRRSAPLAGPVVHVCHEVFIVVLQGGFGFGTYPVTARCHWHRRLAGRSALGSADSASRLIGEARSTRQELLRIERHLLLPQMEHRAADLRFENRMRLLHAPLH